MKHVRLSLIDTDQSIQAMTQLDFSDKEKNKFLKFIELLKEELATGQTAMLEIDGILTNPVVFSIAEAV